MIYSGVQIYIKKRITAAQRNASKTSRHKSSIFKRIFYAVILFSSRLWSRTLSSENIIFSDDWSWFSCKPTSRGCFNCSSSFIRSLLLEIIRTLSHVNTFESLFFHSTNSQRLYNSPHATVFQFRYLSFSVDLNRIAFIRTKCDSLPIRLTRMKFNGNFCHWMATL